MQAAWAARSLQKRINRIPMSRDPSTRLAIACVASERIALNHGNAVQNSKCKMTYLSLVVRGDIK